MIGPQKRYVAGWKCSKCLVPLSDNQRMYSHGVCPFCGYDSDSTICNTETVVRLRGPSFWARIRDFFGDAP